VILTTADAEADFPGNRSTVKVLLMLKIAVAVNPTKLLSILTISLERAEITKKLSQQRKGDINILA